jgi:hypothetical protein
MSAEVLRRFSTESGPDEVKEEKRKTLSKSLALYGFGSVGLLAIIGLLPDLAFGIWGSVMDESAIGNLRNQAAAKGGLALGALRGAALLALLVYATRKFLLDERNTLAFGLIAAVAVAVDGFWVNSHFLIGYDVARTLPTEPAIARLKADTSDFRVFGLPRAYERWYMHYHGLETADGWTDNETRVYREFRGGDYVQNPNLMAGLTQRSDGTVSGSAFMDLLNVKYLAFRNPQYPGLQIVENTSALPRALFVPHWESLPDSLTLNRMLQGFEPRSLAFVSAADGLPSSPAPLVSNESVTNALPVEEDAQATSEEDAKANRKTNSEIQAEAKTDTALASDSTTIASSSSNAETTHTASIQVPTTATLPSPPQATITKISKSVNQSSWKIAAPTSGLFVLSELWFPHWTVTVDGKDASLLRVNYAMRGVKLESGTHEIRFSYRSPWIAKGFMVAGMSVILLMAFAYFIPLLENRRNRLQ